jgi:hypothetical protein
MRTRLEESCSYETEILNEGELDRLKAMQQRGCNEPCWLAKSLAISLLELEAICFVTWGLYHLICSDSMYVSVIVLLSSDSFNLVVISNYSTVNLKCRDDSGCQPISAPQRNEVDEALQEVVSTREFENV